MQLQNGKHHLPLKENYPHTKTSSLKWTANVVDLVELIYGLFHCKCINNGEVTIKQLVSEFECFFSIKIRRSSHAFIRIRERIRERVTFLSNMVKKLDDYIKGKD